MTYRYADVETKLGAVRACFTNRDHVYAACAADYSPDGRQGDLPPLTINGVEYACCVYLCRNPRGDFAPCGISSYRIGSRGYQSRHDLEVAHHEIVRDVVPALQAWARSNPRLAYEAEADDCRLLIESLGRRIAEHQSEIDDLTARRVACETRLGDAEAMARALDDDKTTEEHPS